MARSYGLKSRTFCSACAPLQKHDALALAAIASSSGGRVSAVAVFLPPPLSEDDDAAAALAASRATIVIDGASDADVARAALAVDALLAARFPSAFASLSVPASVFSVLSASPTPAPAAAGDAAAAATAVLSVASLRASTGATLALDADNSRVVAWGAPAQVAAVASALRAASADVAARRAELPISHWMGPAIVGKKGAGLAALEAALPAGCSVKVSFDSEEARGAGAGAGPAHRGHGHGHGPALQTLMHGEVPHVSVTAPTPAALATALEHVRGVVAGLAKLRVFLSIPASAFGSIIGKGGSIIKALQVRRLISVICGGVVPPRPPPSRRSQRLAKSTLTATGASSLCAARLRKRWPLGATPSWPPSRRPGTTPRSSASHSSPCRRAACPSLRPSGASSLGAAARRSVGCTTSQAQRYGQTRSPARCSSAAQAQPSSLPGSRLCAPSSPLGPSLPRPRRPPLRLRLPPRSQPLRLLSQRRA